MKTNNNTGRREMKTSEPKYGSYGSGIGTYVMLMAAAAIVTLILRWVG